MVSSGYYDGSCSSATKVRAPFTMKNRISAFTSDTRPRVRVSKTEVTGELLPQIVGQLTTTVASPSEKQHTLHRMEDLQQFCPIHRTKHPLAHCRIFKAKTLQSRLILINQWKICSRCTLSTNHSAKECQVTLRCSHCDSTCHCSALQDDSCAILDGPAWRQFIKYTSNPESVGWVLKEWQGATLSD